MQYVYRIDAADGTRVHTDACAAGPWNPQLQHGGAPASLIVRYAERIPTQVPMRISRLTVDLLRPVPIAPLEVATEVVREGRKIQLCSVRLRANGIEVARASVLKTRIAEATLPAPIGIPALELPGPESGEIRGLPFTPPPSTFAGGVTLHAVRGGGFRELGPSAIWFHAHRPIVDGEDNSPAMRAALTADFSNGISSVLSFTEWTFINGDLSVSFARAPVGEWILLDAESWIGTDGGGIAVAQLADVHGYFARSVQGLVVERR
jgi:Thioesterase-like superfamily